MGKAAAHYSGQVGEALNYAADVHARQSRKGKTEPYLSHLLQVAAVIFRYGGSEEQVIAGILHDMPEDHGGESRLAGIEAVYGPRVAAIVRACSDSLSEDAEEKAPWRERKAQHLTHLRHEQVDGMPLVAAANKIANLNDLVHDLRNAEGDPDATLSRFRGKAVGTRAYYASMLAILGPELPEPARDQLAELLTALGAEPVPNGEDPVEFFYTRTLSLTEQ